MTTLRQGDRSPAVRELQLLLAMTGHAPGPIDGIFGPLTRTALFAATLREDAPADTVAEVRGLPRRAVEVPRVLTPASAVDVRIALVTGYASTFIHPDEPAGVNGLAVRVALAQLCVEHGRGPWRVYPTVPPVRVLPWCEPVMGEESYVAIWTNNIGNRQVAREDRRDSYSPMGPPTVPHFMLTAFEGFGELARKITSACYAYPNLAEGAAGYWRFLRDHCGPALAAFERGDPAAAAHELKVGRWHYSGSEADYTRAMVDRFRAIE